MKFWDGALESFARSRLGAWAVINVFTHIDRRLLRWSGGRLSTGVGTRFHEHGTLLTTTGARTGLPRTAPVISFEDGEDRIVVASWGAHPRNPAWYFNLKANPDCTVTIKGIETSRIAREARGEERDRLWQKAVGVYAGWEDYRQRTDRKMPIMILSRREGGRPTERQAASSMPEKRST